MLLAGFPPLMHKRLGLVLGVCLSSVAVMAADESTIVDTHVVSSSVAGANIAETMVVTATREATAKSELAESVSVLDAKQLELIGPSHPAEALNRVAGVHINNLGGEGHMSAIRQPITTAGVYLFLEDGIPTRPSGFFNHNGLYEINVSQGSRLEVTKGPASALYGSDAIGGVINSLTKPAPRQTETDINYEAGAHGWNRLLASFGTDLSDDTGLRLDINATDSQGYRDESDYGRYSTTLRLDSQLTEDWRLKLVGSYTDVDQSGTSDLFEADYRSDPEKNRFHDDIGFREVQATRLSAEFEYTFNEQQQLTITPYYRDNQMLMMPSWMVTYDPNIRDYQFQSYGALIKFRQNLAGGKGRVIVGLDADYTPSRYREEAISVSLDGDIYRDYQPTGTLNYDFDTEQASLSPYVHSDWQLGENWHLNAGVRYDKFEVDYDNNLASLSSGSHQRPSSQSLSYQAFSPKLGLVWQYHADHNAYINARRAFRAPTIGQLFRPGSSSESVELEPVRSDSVELGLRGRWAKTWSYELALYDMQIEDDIVSYINGFTRISTNAGETSHRGIELTLAGKLTDELSLALAVSKTQQEYRDFSYIYQCFSPACGGFTIETRNFSGSDVGKAPETMGSLTLGYQPRALAKLSLEVEWEHMGGYYTDETNSAEYDGHNLFNLRANYQLSNRWAIYGRVMNLTDRRYSTYTSNQVGNSNIGYRPGLPRSLYLGVRGAF